MKKILLLVLLFALSQPVHAIEPFTITDIRVEGLERLDAGTVYNYLPLKVGDEVDDEEARLSIKELFRTGFFKDVSFAQDGTTLVVKVVERPSIASITIRGNDKLKTEDIKQGLDQAGLVEGRILNNANLDQFEQELKSTYLSMGRYSATVESVVEDMERNRAGITIEINEGRVARIKKVNIIGAEKISVKDLKDEMILKEKRGFKPFSRRDQYSKQQLEADLESIRSYYQNRGYHEFEIVSSNVEISPNKQNIFISIIVNEGDLYSFGGASIEGVEDIAALEGLVLIEAGESFSLKTVNESAAAISDKFADDGYAFVEVRHVFDTDEESKIVNTVFTVIPNQRVYVRRIDISGNLYTRDEVIRRELRQFEGSWYSAAAVRRSKDRLNRLGIFQSVQIETPKVPGTKDQIDMKVVVTERDTGSILLSAGYSDEDGLLLGIEFEQRNLLGTGKTLAISFNDSDAANTAEVSYTNPYHTENGVSRGFRFLSREVDSSEVDTAEYIVNTLSLGVLYKIPIAETNTINFGLAAENIELEATPETPPEFLPTIAFSQPDSDNFVLTSGLSKDSRDDFFFPTRGSAASATLELAVPGSDFEYYKVNLQGSTYFPLSGFLTLKGGLSLGYGDGFGDTSDLGLPFFKNYFAGGPRTVRGYDSRSLGPKDSGATPEPIGGDRRILLNAEVLFPPFGAQGGNDKRLGFFVDGGQVYGQIESVDLGEIRYSTGLFFKWFSPVGPFSISYAFPLNDEEGDDTEELQLSIGTVFQ
jgi:outer membrane protein insertion porin family